MAKFKNVTTGNVIRVKNEKTVALIEKSANYAPYVAEKKAGKQGKNTAPAAPATDAE